MMMSEADRMKKVLAYLYLGLGMAFLTSGSVFASLPLHPLGEERLEVSNIDLDELGFDDQLWGRPGQPGDKQSLLTAIDYSLRYLQTSRAENAYRRYQVEGITRDRVIRSLLRFRELVATSQNPAELEAAVKREFVLYKSIGKDNRGTVSFTGYFEPTYSASRVPTADYRYPLYRLPPDLGNWSYPHPARAEIEGIDGLLGEKSPLHGLELVWLRDRFEAFLVHVQGSARLQLTDGSTMTVGYAGSTNYSYTSVGKELVKDGIVRRENLTLPALIDYFSASPEAMNRYLPRNRSYVFFRETHGRPATGSLGVPVTAERSIATDKSVMPPGALALIQTQLPYANANGELEFRRVSRYVLDQDTGGAIKGAGRVDVFMGTGPLAGDRAGLINNTGQLYYLLLER